MIIAVEIGGTKLQVALADDSEPKILNTTRFSVDKSSGATGILKIVSASVGDYLKTQNDIEAIVIGFGGPVDPFTGQVATSHQIGGWSGFELKQWAEKEFKLPALIGNDANVAALAEAYFGAGINYSPVLYVTLGSGVGAGLVNKGQLYTGNFPGEAEIGHLNLDGKGTTLESLCSGWALDTQIREQVKQLKHKTLLSSLTENISAHEARYLLAAMEKKDESATTIFDSYIKNLCWGLSHAVHLFSPQIIILGGGVSLMGEPLRFAVQQQLPALLAKVLLPGPVIALAMTGENAVLLGAIKLYQVSKK